MGLVTHAGQYVQQPAGYRAFIPSPLPIDPPLRMDALQVLLSEADQALGRLDGLTEIVPNADLFVAMYVRREAVLSSQIEGTQRHCSRNTDSPWEPHRTHPKPRTWTQRATPA